MVQVPVEAAVTPTNVTVVEAPTPSEPTPWTKSGGVPADTRTASAWAAAALGAVPDPAGAARSPVGLGGALGFAWTPGGASHPAVTAYAYGARGALASLTPGGGAR